MSAPDTDHKGDAAKRYHKLVTERDTYLMEAFESAKLTIPSLVPDTSDACDAQDVRELPKPWQSLGARGVNNLANKLLLTLLPPNNPFLRFEITPDLFALMSPEEENEVKTRLQQLLAKRERAVMKELDAHPYRVKVSEIIRQLLVAGSCLVYLAPDGGTKVFKLNAFVWRRDTEGNLLESIAVEVLDRVSLSPEFQALLDETPEDAEANRDKPVRLYTRLVREHDDKLSVYQELEGREVPGTRQSFSDDDCPWLALRYVAIDGEHYGRGFVEEYRGDLLSLEELSKAICLASLNAARLIALVNPNATVKIRALKKAQNGDYLQGEEGDVHMLRLDKNADMQVALEFRRDLEQHLSADFMLNQSFQRQAERVTAEEIRRMAEELEDNLGGVYSLLSQTLQLPLAKRLERNLVRRKALRPLPKGSVTPQVVTGLAAIGRGHDLQRLRDAVKMVEEIAAVFPEAAQQIHVADLVKRIFLGAGVDVDGLLKTQEQVQAEQQAAREQQMQQQLLEKGTGPFASAAAESMAGSGAQGGGLQQLVAAGPQPPVT